MTAQRAGSLPGAQAGVGIGWRVVAAAGRVEAARLCRSPLVLASVIVAAALAWLDSRSMVPQWWVWDVQIGSVLLIVSGGVLLAAQLAAGRVRRDGAEQLYESFPAPASARVFAHLAGVTGPTILAALLAAAIVAWIDLLGPVGSPAAAVLWQGLALVVLGGAIGVALGSWLPHPTAGILAFFVLGVAEAGLYASGSLSAVLPFSAAWLFPWTQPVIARWLPGPTPLNPPAVHLAWLAALAGLAALAALWRFVPRPAMAGRTSVLALATAICVAVAGWSGWAQARPVGARAQDSLIYQAIHPGRIEQCISRQRVRYCAYPGFGSDVARWSAVVDGVLGRLPWRQHRELTVRQVDANFGLPSPDGGGYERPTPAGLALGVTLQDVGLARFNAALGRFIAALSTNPRLVPGSGRPPVYVGLSWATGSAAGPYQLGLALQAAWWVARLPTTWWRAGEYNCGHGCPPEPYQVSCLPVGQAREAIALWLAASATPATRPVFLAGLHYGLGGSKVGRAWVASYTGALVAGYRPAVQYTAKGALLARAMLRLPPRRVQGVLAARWPGWLSPRATDGQLAAALRIPMPRAPSPIYGPSPGQPANAICP